MEIPLTHGPLKTTATADDAIGSSNSSTSTTIPGRTYHVVTIPTTRVQDGTSSTTNNILRCCFISDVTSDTSAASMCVNVGQLHDSETSVEGIAHLTEHLVFMGSRTFPKENDYDQYIQQQCGGSTNAYTDLHQTVYYFDVMNSTTANTSDTTDDTVDDDDAAAAVSVSGGNEKEEEVEGKPSVSSTDTKSMNSSSNTTSTNNKKSSTPVSLLYGAIHRFLCAILQPLLSISSVERELLAIDSEHSKNMTQDHWRVHQLSKCIWGGRCGVVSNPTSTGATDSTAPTTRSQYHPYANFGTGNKSSLLQQATSTSTSTSTSTTTTTASTAANTLPQDEPQSGDNDGITTENPANTIPDGTSSSTNNSYETALQQRVCEFFTKQYTDSNMTLCILSNISVADIQAMVQEILYTITDIPTTSNITNKDDNNDDNKEFNNNLQNTVIPTAAGSASNTADGTTATATTLTTTTTTTTIPPLPRLPNVTMVQWVPLRGGGDYYPLELQWVLPIPMYSQYYRSKPTRYYSHLLGHEGPGSLLHVLRHEKQWVQELSADDTSTDTPSFTIFTMSLELTATGFQHVTEIVQMIFHYIDAILLDEEGGIPTWVHDELQVMGDTTFTFLPKYDASQTVSTIACNMHQYRDMPEHYLSGPYKIYDYDPNMIQTIGQSLSSAYCATNHNLLILLGSSTFADVTDQIDPWYGTQYRIVPITDTDQHIWVQYQERRRNQNNSDINNLVSNLRLPDRNDMLPTDFTLLTSSIYAEEMSSLWNFTQNKSGPFSDPVNSSPKCIRTTDTSRVWYKPDAIYQTPKVNVICLFRTPIISKSTSPAISVQTTMLVEIISELCNEFTYAASMAGLHCGARESLSNGGIELTISGYNHKCHTLLQRICQTIQTQLPIILSSNDHTTATTTTGDTTTTTNQFFERIRNKVEQRYESILVAQPYQHGSMVADLILDATNYGSVHVKLQYVRNKTLLTSQDMIQFSKQVLSCFHLEVLVHGNVLPKVAMDWTDIIINTFQPTAPSPSQLMIGPRGIVLPNSGKTTTTIYRDKGYNEHDENSCVVNLYQIGIVDIPTNAKLSLLLQLLREPAFNVLRTEEQLGYIVFTSVKTIADNVKHVMFLIQSDSYDPIHMNERIEHFLIHFRDKIVMELSDDDFMTNVTSLCDGMLEKSKNLSEESMKHWTVIQNRTYYFQRIKDIVAAIRTLQKIDIIRFFDRYILGTSPYRRKLSIQLFGTAHESMRQELLLGKSTKQEQTEITATSTSTINAGSTTTSTTITGGEQDIVINHSDVDEFVHGRCYLYPTQTIGSVQEHVFAPTI